MSSPDHPFRPRTRRPKTLLQRLGIIGMDTLEPVVIAALATESPLLLIGPHGTAKSLLLVRLSEALRLSVRHYNASLLNYDDLVGYPLPDESGKLRFVETPASIWEAEVVFLDEISRCRPDMQNRLFSIIHEKRVQGMSLDRLTHRWAAMNPPVSEDGDGDGEDYLGSEPLDPALADRFSFVIEVPRWQSLGNRQRETVIQSRNVEIAQGDAELLQLRIRQTIDEIDIVEQAIGSAVAEYVRVMMDQAAQLGLQLSGRRGAMLYRNIIGIHAARLAQFPTADPNDSAWLAIEHSLPQRAHGVNVDRGRLFIAHNEAWKTVNLDKLDPRRLLSSEPDPVKRAIRAASIRTLPTQEVSAYIADGLAQASPGGRHALAAFVMESPAIAKLNAAIAEQVAELHAICVTAQDVNEQVWAGRDRHRAWDAIIETVAKLPDDEAETRLITNVLSAMFAAEDIARPEDVPGVLQAWRSVRDLCKEFPVEEGDTESEGLK